MKKLMIACLMVVSTAHGQGLQQIPTLPKIVPLCGDNGDACRSAPTPVCQFGGTYPNCNAAPIAQPVQPQLRPQVEERGCFFGLMYHRFRSDLGVSGWGQMYWPNGSARTC